MFVDVAFGLIIGILVGIVTGLLPGLHINQVASIVLVMIGTLSIYFSMIALVSFLVSMAITHSILDFIPAIFFGAPSDSSVMAMLPGHELLLSGRGYDAVALSMIGGVLGISLLALLTPLLILIIPLLYELIRNYIGGLLAGVLLLQLLRERTIWSVGMVLLSGALGYIVFSLPNLQQPLLPLLTGLFGTSALYISMHSTAALPVQTTTQRSMPYYQSISGMLASTVLTILPAIGPAQAALLVKDFTRMSKRGYLVATGAIGTSSMAMGLITLLTIDRGRNGVLVVVGELVRIEHVFWILLLVALIAAGTSYLIGKQLAGFIALNLWRINYSLFSKYLLICISVFVLAVSRIEGLIVLTISTYLGVIAIKKNVPRHYLMSALIVPVVFYYL